MAYKKNYKPTKSAKEKLSDTEQRMVEATIAAMAKGELIWDKGRADPLGAPVPTAMYKGTPYRGFNALNLMILGSMRGSSSNYYGTYNQMGIIGGHKKDYNDNPDNLPQQSRTTTVVKRPFYKNAQGQLWFEKEAGGRRMFPTKDEIEAQGLTQMDPQEQRAYHPLMGTKAAADVFFYKPWYKDPKTNKGWYVYENGKKREEPTAEEIKKYNLDKVLVLKSYVVFDYEDMSHASEHWLQKRNLIERNINRDDLEGTHDARLAAIVEQIKAKLGVDVIHEATVDTPHYQPSKDIIKMPPREMYKDDQRYYHTLLHEMAHATGHQSRLNRESLHTYSEAIENRAYEELVAEFSGMFMSSQLGLLLPSATEMDSHAAYIKSWHSRLCDDAANGEYGMLRKAATDAQRAVDFLTKDLDLNLENKQEKPKKKAPVLDDDGMSP